MLGTISYYLGERKKLDEAPDNVRGGITVDELRKLAYASLSDAKISSTIVNKYLPKVLDWNVMDVTEIMAQININRSRGTQNPVFVNNGPEIYSADIQKARNNTSNLRLREFLGVLDDRVRSRSNEYLKQYTTADELTTLTINSTGGYGIYLDDLRSWQPSKH